MSHTLCKHMRSRPRKRKSKRTLRKFRKRTFRAGVTEEVSEIPFCSCGHVTLFGTSYEYCFGIWEQKEGHLKCDHLGGTYNGGQPVSFFAIANHPGNNETKVYMRIFPELLRPIILLGIRGEILSLRVRCNGDQYFLITITSYAEPVTMPRWSLTPHDPHRAVERLFGP